MLLPCYSLEIEFEIDAEAYQVVGQADRDGNTRHASSNAAGCCASHAPGAEIGVEVFELGRPVLGKSDFDSDTGGPAGLGMCGGDAALCYLLIAKDPAARAVEQDAIHRETYAPTQRAQPSVPGLTISGDNADAASGTAVDAGPVEITFDAEDESAGLEIGTERA